MAGIIYLIPVPLGGEDYRKVIPENVISITRSLRHFIVEDLRSARRFLRSIDREFPIDDTVFHELNEHTPDSELPACIEAVINGADAGIMSEAGLPGIADPGARVVSLAHRKNIRVIPLSGPSSILLALISSGFNGQNFTFNGYLPVKPVERAARIREVERKAREGFAQIFMETPYRNQKMFETLMQVCNGETMLCIASDITLSSESIRSMKVSEWKNKIPLLDGRPTVFILQ